MIYFWHASSSSNRLPPQIVTGSRLTHSKYCVIGINRLNNPHFHNQVWDDAHVQSLLVSIARSFPVGAVMLLETGGEVRFQVRPIENLDFVGQVPEPERLILDGQQRLTSLTQVLALNKPVKTFNEKGKPISCNPPVPRKALKPALR